jgi:hypothetical protein
MGEAFAAWDRLRIQHYIEWNPVKAGLVTQPEQSRWFSASPG